MLLFDMLTVNPDVTLARCRFNYSVRELIGKIQTQHLDLFIYIYIYIYDWESCLVIKSVTLGPSVSAYIRIEV